MRLPLEFFARMDFQDTSFNYRCWKLEEWKNVIWNGETFAGFDQRCGVTRVWDKADEAYNPICIRGRWTGPSDFIFWGCVSYNKKGPCDIWKPETIHEKKNAEKEPGHGLQTLSSVLWTITLLSVLLGLLNVGGSRLRLKSGREA